jgi:hypothetical protein
VASPVKDDPTTAKLTNSDKSNFKTILAYELISSTGCIVAGSLSKSVRIKTLRVSATQSLIEYLAN